jgi:hypothetical protein
LKTQNAGAALDVELAVTYAGAARAHATLGETRAALDAAHAAEIVLQQAPDDPGNPGRRGMRAQTYEFAAEAYVALATRPRTPRAAASAHWGTACRMWQSSHDIWIDMERRGTLAGSDRARADAVARELDRCTAKLSPAR